MRLTLGWLALWAGIGWCAGSGVPLIIGASILIIVNLL